MSVATRAEVPQAAPSLRRNSVGLIASIASVVTTLAPAVSALFTVPFLAGTSGLLSPIVLVAAAAIGLMLGYTLAQLARQIVSAGSYYTYISLVLGKRFGFLAGWVYLLFYPVAAGMLGALFGYTLQTVMQAHWGWSIPWQASMFAFYLAVLGLCWFGVEISTRTAVTLGSFEIVVCLVLALWGFVDPGGSARLTTPGLFHSPGGQLVFLGFVFSIYSYVGFDASVPLAEETRNPHKTVPPAIFGSIIVMMIFFVVTTWGEFSGWGLNHLASFATSPQAPAFVLAERYWGGAWIILLIAFGNSAFGAALSCVNASARVMYSMSKTGVLPAYLGKVSARRLTPSAALLTQLVINAVVGVGLSAVVHVANLYAFTGLLFTFSLAFIFIAANAAAFLLYRRQVPTEFSWIKHFAIPVVSTAALIVVVYESLHPWPAYPDSLALPMVGAWMLVGLVVLVVRLRAVDSGDLDAVVIPAPSGGPEHVAFAPIAINEGAA